MTVEQEAATNGQGAGQNGEGQEQGGGESTLLTKDLGDKGAEEGANKQPGGGESEKEKSGVPENPESYDFTFAEGTQVDKELLGDFRCAAHELGLSQGKAQKLASLYEAHAAKAGERAAEAQRQAIESAKTKWEGEIEARPAFTQERDHARAALRQYGSKELYELMDQTNLGSHPEMWAFMARIGKELAEPGFHGKNGGKKQSAADVLYPNQGR